MDFFLQVLSESWMLFLDASAYILFGLIVSGLMKVFLNPSSVMKHMGYGRFQSVFKAALLGIPIPLCSCGVLPAAVSLKKQGANSGATTAFMISTPESGVDSIAVSYALLDPIMTITRPVVAFVTAAVAGITENLFESVDKKKIAPDLSCPIDGCCDGIDCLGESHKNHHTWLEKIKAGLIYSVTEVWSDMAGWFFIGLLLAGVISALVPAEILGRYLGEGIASMVIMLVIGIPLYICATASTPIAAALVLKGVSPGAALVFLLAGPATNMASLSVLFGVLGKRATAIYLSTIGLSAILFGLLLNKVYQYFDISAQAVMGHSGEVIPVWMQWVSASLLILFSIRHVTQMIRTRIKKESSHIDHSLCVHPGSDSPHAAPG